MTGWQKKLAAHFLEMAAAKFDIYKHHDFDLAAVVPDVNARRAIMKTYHKWNGDPESYDPGCSYEGARDHAGMLSLMAHLLREDVSKGIG